MPDLALPSDAFRLGALVVVPSLNRLLRDGDATDVEPRVMAVLAALAEAPGEVVTRDALLASVWADTVINDEALTRAVSELRKALGAEARGAVETIRGRGYRLALAVEPVAPSVPRAARPAAPSPARRHALAPLALALGVVSLAVSLWAVARTGAPAPDGPPPTATTGEAPDDPVRLDSTSQYFRTGLSDRGVYYDAEADRYFWFTTDAAE